MVSSLVASVVAPVLAYAVPATHTPLLAERDTIAFAVVAGMPQTSDQVPRAQAVLHWIAHQPGIDFIVHLGDLRTASDPCSDALFANREAVLNVTPAPLIFVPGENDWATCATAPGGGDPVERLDALRDSFFSGAMSLGNPGMRLIRQSELPAFRPYRENTRWIEHGVVFVTLNVPSGNNHFSDAGGRNGEYEDREVANRDWITRALTDARRRRARALIFFFQADPVTPVAARRTRSGFASWFSARREHDGYAGLRRDFRAAAEAFTGPVLIVHTTAASSTESSKSALAAEKSRTVVSVEPMLHPSRNGKPLHNLLQLQLATPSPDHAWLKIIIRMHRGTDNAPSFHAVLETAPARLPAIAAPSASASADTDQFPDLDQPSANRVGQSADTSDSEMEGLKTERGRTGAAKTAGTADIKGENGAGDAAPAQMDGSNIPPPFPASVPRSSQDTTGAPVYDDGNDGWAGMPEEPHTLVDPSSVFGDISRPVLRPLPPQTTSPLGAPAR